MLFANFSGADSFNLHRDVVDDSHEVHETTTIDDDLVDSREDSSNHTITDDGHTSGNDTSNVSIENDHHDSREIHEATTIDDDLVDSREHANNHTSMDGDVLHLDDNTHDNDSLENNSLVKRNAPQLQAEVHPWTTDDYYDDYSWEVVHSPETTVDGRIQPATSSLMLVKDMDDNSTEVPDHDVSSEDDLLFPAELGAVQPHLVNLPSSDDWFLVKQYMDDYYFWELGDDLAKEYFWHPVKSSASAIENESAEKLNKAQFAQFAPVHDPWNAQHGAFF